MRQMSATPSRLRIGDAEIACERRGSGKPLVILNGYAATLSDWDPGFMAALETERELVLVDHRGIGESTWNGRPFSIAELADDAASLIGALELDRPPILGWSMGGMVTLALGLEHNELCGPLVLLSTTAGGAAAPRMNAETRMRMTDFSGTPREQASRLISLLFTPARAEEIDREFGEIVAEARASLPQDTARAQWRAIEEWQARGVQKRLGEIASPALIATGQEDVVIPPGNAALLAESIPDAWLARFPHSGHGFMADHPVAAARLILAFLAVV